jgi:hypothetical protein
MEKEMKEAPAPLLASDSIPAVTNGRAVWWNLDSYRVISGSAKLDDGRCVADLEMGEVAVLDGDEAIVQRCKFQGDRKERLSKMGQKEPRREVSGLPASAFSKADARGDGYVAKHAKLHREDIITTMEIMGLIPCAPKLPKMVSYIHNGKNYVVRMVGRGDYNYYMLGIDGVETWTPKSNNLWQHVLRCENGDEIGVESVAESSMVLVGNVDDEDWDGFLVDCGLLGLTVIESKLGV